MSKPSTSPVVIVVVEDELLIRMATIDALSEIGWTVHEAPHASAALEALRRMAAEVHAVFTDIEMPGPMNGLKLGRHVEQHWPWIAVLVTSGRYRPGPDEMPSRGGFLPKPYKSEHVVARIRELVEVG